MLIDSKLQGLVGLLGSFVLDTSAFYHKLVLWEYFNVSGSKKITVKSVEKNLEKKTR